MSHLKKSKNIVLVFFLFIGLYSFFNLAFAADPAPLSMLKSVSKRMTVELDKHLGNLKNNEPLVTSIVNRVLVPNFDLVTTAQLVVGRSYWQSASANTQREFINQFTRYAVKTYAAAISSYDGEEIKFYPMRETVSTSRRTQVRSAIIHKDGPPISVQYSVLYNKGRWLVYDFSIDGVSMAQNYRAQFAGSLRRGGLDQLVLDLKARNR